jgi:hypothetical protein
VGCGREEASCIPTLLVAPRMARAWGEGGQDGDGDGDGEGVDRSIYENGIGDSRGWYEDGAYTAAPASPTSSVSGASDDKHSGERGPQEVYYEALLGRFEALRQQLAQVPPRHVVEGLGPNHGSYMSASVKDYRMWRWRLGNTEPKPAQLAGMDKGTVLRLLRMLGDRKGGFLGIDTFVGDGGVEARRRVSAWVWGLLARLPGRGELLSEEVGIVRELGKRAVWLGVEMKGVDMGELQEQIENGGEQEVVGDEEVVDVEVDGEDEDLELAEDDEGFTNGDERTSRNQHRDASSPARQNSSSFLDPEAPPIIGPISPESLRGQSTRNFNSISNCDDPEIPAEGTQENEEEALAAARARLLARLGSPTVQQPLTPAETLTLINETDPIISAITDNNQETREYIAALQKQLDRLASQLKRQTDQPLRQKLENKVAVVKLAMGIREWEMRKKYGSGFGKGDVDGVGSGDGELVAGKSDEHAQEGVEDVGEHGHDRGVVEDEHEAGEEQEEDKQSAIQATKTLLDMIITIAGEVYGQRDLLEFREVWE